MNVVLTIRSKKKKKKKKKKPKAPRITILTTFVRFLGHTTTHLCQQHKTSRVTSDAKRAVFVCGGTGGKNNGQILDQNSFYNIYGQKKFLSDYTK